MSRTLRPAVTAMLLLLPGALLAIAQDPAINAEFVKGEFLHAWNAYRKFAWGHDELRPLSKRPHDWHGASLMARHTPDSRWSAAARLEYYDDRNGVVVSTGTENNLPHLCRIG